MTTIEEMLEWTNRAWRSAFPASGEELTAYNHRMRHAIRAILERHADGYFERKAIRAFVERVEKRLPDYNTGKGADSWLKAYRLAVMDELAALEKETQ